MKIYNLHYAEQTASLEAVEELQPKLDQRQVIEELISKYDALLDALEAKRQSGLTDDMTNIVNLDELESAFLDEPVLEARGEAMPKKEAKEIEQIKDTTSVALTNSKTFIAEATTLSSLTAEKSATLAIRPRALTIGFFDAVHRGHQELINRLVYLAKLRNYEACVYSFDHLPKVQAGQLVLSQAQRRSALAALGVASYIEQKFTEEFANLSARAFVEQILVQTLHVKLLVVGANFSFGKANSFNPSELGDLCAEFGIELVIVPPLMYNKQVISTTWIRQLLLAGQVEEATKLMGRPFSVTGIVKSGQGLARDFNFPTANICWNNEQLKLPYGVYATRTKAKGVRYNSITNYGLRPTVVQDAKEAQVETSLLEVSMDLYDREITVEFLNFQRPEKKFPSFLILTTAIQKDVQTAKDYLKSNEDFYCYYEEPSFPIYHIPSQRFFSSNLCLLVALPLTPYNATCLNLLGNILTACNAKLPTRTEFLQKLDELYGVHLSNSVCALGDVVILQFNLLAIRKAPDGRFIFREAANLLFDCLLEPLVDEAGYLDAQIFAQEQQNLASDLRSKIDDRENYAIKLALENLYAQTAYATDPNGDPECLAKLTPKALTEFWQQLLKQAQFSLFTGGSLGSKTLVQLKNQVERLLNEAGSTNSTSSTSSSDSNNDAAFASSLDSAKNGERFKLCPNLSPSPYRLQSKIALKTNYNFLRSRYLLFFSNLPSYSSRDCVVLQVLLALLVGDTQALFYKRLREDLGLIYGLNYDLLIYMDCIALILSLNEENVETAKAEIHNLMQQLLENGISDAAFDNAKLFLFNQVRNTDDSLQSLLSFYVNRTISGFAADVEVMLDCIANITKTEVLEMAKALTVNGSYHIVGEGATEDDE